ncbi:hypothetical protein [uncultured Pseudodesulfovibrio sp.]|uniref:hypothetical protein n=1 Tax=uncultured Pseudodesulfovibrio sp. TaxID=2035858 RepID=UPI0029C8665D|nr:hypothetical protein [uncultured Pseudodesulfovibrio sp.]
MENKIAELKSLIAKLTLEVSKMKLEHVEDRVFFKALNSTVDHLHGQVQNLDKQIEAGHKKVAAQTKEQQTTEAAKKMSLTAIGELYKKDPVAARKAMEAQGMKIDTETSANPWLFKDVSEQNRIRSIDPELANRLEAEAAARYAASIR